MQQDLQQIRQTLHHERQKRPRNVHIGPPINCDSTPTDFLFLPAPRQHSMRNVLPSQTVIQLEHGVLQPLPGEREGEGEEPDPDVLGLGGGGEAGGEDVEERVVVGEDHHGGHGH